MDLDNYLKNLLRLREIESDLQRLTAEREQRTQLAIDTADHPLVGLKKPTENDDTRLVISCHDFTAVVTMSTRWNLVSFEDLPALLTPSQQ